MYDNVCRIILSTKETTKVDVYPNILHLLQVHQQQLKITTQHFCVLVKNANKKYLFHIKQVASSVCVINNILIE